MKILSVNEKRAEKISENKQIFLKSIFFVLSIYFLVSVICVLSYMELIDSVASFFSFICIYLISLPMYFFLKSNIKKTWRYLSNMAIVNGAFLGVGVVIVLILCAMELFKDWERVAVIFIIANIFCGILSFILIDLVYLVFNWQIKRKK